MPSVVAATTSDNSIASSNGTELVQRHAAAQPWHNSQAHRFIRKLMILRLRRLYPALAVPSTPTNTPTSTTATATSSSSMDGQPAAAAVPPPSGTRASLAQRLEWMLYHAAFSMEEYGNQRTLERRIRALATHIEPSANALARLSGVKRPSEQMQLGDEQVKSVAGKRQRQDPAADSAVIEASRERKQAESQSELFLGNDQCLVAHVMSFLEGIDVLRCRAVNQFMWDAAPSMVHSVRITARVAGLQTLPAGYLSSLLRQCTNLTALTVNNRLNQTDLPTTSTVTRSPKLLSSSSTNQSSLAGSTSPLCSARRVLQEVSSALRAGACANMEVLALDAPMDHLVESAEVVKVVEALVAGRERLRASKVKVAPLKQLVLDATFLGDRRVERLASLLQRGESAGGAIAPDCFGALEAVVLSNNYIGAGGCRALMDVLPTLPALRSLDLGCNILTDLDAIAIADAFDDTPSMKSNPLRGCNDERAGDSPPPPRLRSLCLDDNFIELPGREALRTAAGLQDCQISTARPSAAARSRSRKFGLGGMCR